MEQSEKEKLNEVLMTSDIVLRLRELLEKNPPERASMGDIRNSGSW